MTKAEEIKLLDDIIAQAPKRSYLRTTLRELRVQFESDIRSDFETMPNLAELERERAGLQDYIRSQRKQVSEIETKVRCLRAERERMIIEIHSKAVYIANRALDTRREWENLSL